MCVFLRRCICKHNIRISVNSQNFLYTKYHGRALAPKRWCDIASWFLPWLSFVSRRRNGFYKKFYCVSRLIPEQNIPVGDSRAKTIFLKDATRPVLNSHFSLLVSSLSRFAGFPVYETHPFYLSTSTYTLRVYKQNYLYTVRYALFE